MHGYFLTSIHGYLKKLKLYITIAQKSKNLINSINSINAQNVKELNTGNVLTSLLVIWADEERRNHKLFLREIKILLSVPIN